MDSKISQCSIVNAKDPNAPPKLMTFDGAYYTDSTTEAIYNEIAFPLVEVHNMLVYRSSKYGKVFLDIIICISKPFQNLYF